MEVAQSREWEKIATLWAGNDDWMEARKKKNTTDEKYKFVTFFLSRMKLSSEHPCGSAWSHVS